MAKYVTKDERVGEDALCFPPKRWWGVSKALQAEVDVRTEKEVFFFDDSMQAESAGVAALQVAARYASTVLTTKHPVYEHQIGGIAYVEPESAWTAFQEVLRSVRVGPHYQAEHHWRNHDRCAKEAEVFRYLADMTLEEILSLPCSA